MKIEIELIKRVAKAIEAATADDTLDQMNPNYNSNLQAVAVAAINAVRGYQQNRDTANGN